jgi:hypothetical protein
MFTKKVAITTCACLGFLTVLNAANADSRLSQTDSRLSPTVTEAQRVASIRTMFYELDQANDVSKKLSSVLADELTRHESLAAVYEKTGSRRAYQEMVESAAKLRTLRSELAKVNFEISELKRHIKTELFSVRRALEAKVQTLVDGLTKEEALYKNLVTEFEKTGSARIAEAVKQSAQRIADLKSSIAEARSLLTWVDAKVKETQTW